jgi:hypothetical protein
MEGLLADVGHVAAAGHGRHGRQVSAEAAHDLDDEHPLFRSGAGLVSTLSRFFFFVSDKGTKEARTFVSGKFFST